MRSLLLALLVSWACAEGVAPQQRKQIGTGADATEEERTGEIVMNGAGLHPVEPRRPPKEPPLQVGIEPAPPKPFSYEEWTAEPPTRGEPKIPGPPFPHLEAGGKKEVYDRLRRLRWAIWPVDNVNLITETWIINWQDWIEDGHLATAAEQADAARFCTDRENNAPVHLRANDPSLRELIPKYSDAVRMLYNTQEMRTGLQEELDKMVALVSVYDSSAATYLAKLTELWESIGNKNTANNHNRLALQEKIRTAYGCPSNLGYFNVCWSANVQTTRSSLEEPRCADQR